MLHPSGAFLYAMSLRAPGPISGKGGKGLMIFEPVVVKEEPIVHDQQRRNPSDWPDSEQPMSSMWRRPRARPLPQFAETTGNPVIFAEDLKVIAAALD